jgi:hypothetical protein
LNLFERIIGEGKYHFTKHTAKSVSDYHASDPTHRKAAKKFLAGGGLSPLQKRIRNAKARKARRGT